MDDRRGAFTINSNLEMGQHRRLERHLRSKSVAVRDALIHVMLRWGSVKIAERSALRAWVCERVSQSRLAHSLQPRLTNRFESPMLPTAEGAVDRDRY